MNRIRPEFVGVIMEDGFPVAVVHSANDIELRKSISEFLGIEEEDVEELNVVKVKESLWEVVVETSECRSYNFDLFETPAYV